jgi:translation initiation factor IF-2
MATTPTTKPPIVAIMGHIDHGKSTLLDYIRKTQVVAGEAGGITQHLSAYEITIPYQNTDRSITFLDTPGHAAFSGMRERGAVAADIAILVVSAEDGVKAQTIEALNTIRAANVPFIVAINKIDRPGANIERTKLTLAEKEVLVEGFGGTVPVVAISALQGTNIPDLLETILLVADMEHFTATASKQAEGLVIESHLDPKRGMAATIIIKDGTLKKGQSVVAGTALASTRLMEDFKGASVNEAGPSKPVQLVGFDKLPDVGSVIYVFDKKRDAEDHIADILNGRANGAETAAAVADGTKVVPIVLKTDVSGTGEAIERELSKIAIEGLHIKLIGKGIGSISENDIRLAQSDPNSIIIGFNVGLDARARSANENVSANIQTFDIIYRLIEWLTIELETRRPRKETREVIGTAKVLKTFSKTKEKQVVGCRIESGKLVEGATISIIRRDFPLASGTLLEIQHAKQRVKEIAEGECGILVECKTDIAGGDMLEAYIMVSK